MTDGIPVIQVLDKEHYFTQELVPLPDEIPYPALAPSSLRLRTKVLSLTANNITYAKLGFLLNWWDVNPLPSTTPAPFNDASKYGRTSAWGYAEVLTSTFAPVPQGSYLWGYLPLGTLAQDLEVEAGSVPGQVLVSSAHRRHVMPIYNRYLVHGAPEQLRADIEAKGDGPAYDAVVRVMFETGYLMNAVAFSSVPEETCHPGMDRSVPWTPEMADLTDATVVNLAPGSKAAFCFAHQLRHNRTDAKPKYVVGATSEFSRQFVEDCGFYDAVVSTATSPVEFLSNTLEIEPSSKVVIVDFGGRGNVGTSWTKQIKEAYPNFLMIKIGSEVTETSQASVLEGFKKGGEGVVMNASDMRDRAMEKVGEKAYFDELEAAWKKLVEEGVKGFSVNWGEGMEDLKKGWERLCKGEVRPDEGLAFKL